MTARLVATSCDVLSPPHERFEAFFEFLLARHQRVVLREDLSSRGIELLLPVGDPPFALLELFLAGPQPFLPADERVPLFRERGPFLFEDPAIFLDFGGLILKGGLALPSVRILGLQAFFHFLQCISRVSHRSCGHLRCPPMLVPGAEPPRRRRLRGTHTYP